MHGGSALLCTTCRLFCLCKYFQLGDILYQGRYRTGCRHGREAVSKGRDGARKNVTITLVTDP